MIEVNQSSSTASISLYFPIFLPFNFLFFCSFVSPIFMLYSSVYYLLALIGGKAPFTHSLTHSTRAFISMAFLYVLIYNVIIMHLVVCF